MPAVPCVTPILPVLRLVASSSNRSVRLATVLMDRRPLRRGPPWSRSRLAGPPPTALPHLLESGPYGLTLLHPAEVLND